MSAAVGALGAALGTMVANLSSHRRGWDERWEEFSEWAESGKKCHADLTTLIDADTEAFNSIIAALRLPHGSETETETRSSAIQEATRGAIEVPLRVMEVALESMETIKAMAEIGQETSASDAGVGALCARTAVRGAYMNVRTNVADLEDSDDAADYLSRGRALEEAAERLERQILDLVESHL